MSSHHFVREGQEPALFIRDAVSLTSVEPLLEWAPVVIVSDNAIRDVLKWKIKIDVVLFQTDTIASLSEELADQGPVEILTYNSSEIIPDVIAAFLAQRNCRGVQVMAKSSYDRFEQWISKIRDLDIAIITDNTKWSAIQSTFQKWLPEKTKLDVRSSPESVFETSGLLRVADQSFLATDDGVITIRSSRPFWLGESLEH